VRVENLSVCDRTVLSPRADDLASARFPEFRFHQVEQSNNLRVVPQIFGDERGHKGRTRHEYRTHDDVTRTKKTYRRFVSFMSPCATAWHTRVTLEE